MIYLKKVASAVGVLALGLGAVLAFASPAQADVVHDLDAAGWDRSWTNGSGLVEITDDGLHVKTETTSDKAAALLPVSLTLGQVGDAEMVWTGGTPEPGLQIIIGDTISHPWGVLVGESVYGGNWWLTPASGQDFKDAAPHNGGGSGSQWFGTLAEWAEALGDGHPVYAVGFSLGSGAVGEGHITSLTFGGETYTFAPTPPMSDDCSAYVDSEGWCQEAPKGDTYEQDRYNCDEIGDEHKPINLIDPADDPFNIDGEGQIVDDGIACELPDGNGGGSGQDGDQSDAAAGGGHLPETGIPTLALLAVGGVVVIVGVFCVYALRRRRITFTA